MPFAARMLYRRLGRHYLWLYVGFEVTTAFVVTLGTLGLFALYTQGVSFSEFLVLAAIAMGLVALALVYTIGTGLKLAKPLSDWLRGGREPDTALAAWETAISLPRRLVAKNSWKPFLFISLPASVLYTLEFDLPWYSALILIAGTCIAIAYAGILHFFASELFLRPVVEDVAALLPSDFAGKPVGVPLRWKLLGALPIICVVTAVVASGLSHTGRSLDSLGIDVIAATAVAFTIALELTILITKSVLGPVDDLLDATRRVARGELDARVPVTSGDELGTLAGSFNEMMHGLSEREALRDAFGSYVDPGVAERVLAEGELLEGEDREVTVMFIDVRDFTPFAERSSARETVGFLNEFFDLIVPIVLRHGGHANKFLGDGLLCVFGAPERLPDHPDRALACARDLTAAVAGQFDGSQRVGIGLNSGPVVIGTVGGGGRLEFTVIGDPVNVAARVESATRETGDTVLLTEATRCILAKQPVDLEDRGEIELKGKSELVPVYTLSTNVDERTGFEDSRLTTEA